MRPTRLVADSKESFLDAARQLIDKAKTLSGNIKSLHIIEDMPSVNSNEGSFRLKAHIMKRS